MRSRWLVVALIASLVANLALVGFLLGATGNPPWRTARFDPSVGLTRLIRFLPDERREELLGNVDWRRDARRSFGAIRYAQHDIQEAMAAEPFNPEALATALDLFRERFAASQGRSHAALVDIMAQLTPTERRRFLETMSHMRDPDNRRGRRSDGRGRERPQTR